MSLIEKIDATSATSVNARPLNRRLSERDVIMGLF